MDIQANRTVTVRVPPGTAKNPPAATLVSVAEPKVDAAPKIDFQHMTVGEYIDTLNHLCQSGQITHEEALDIYITCIPPTAPCATNAEHLRLPMRISYDRMRDEIAELASGGRLEERDRHQRVLDLLVRLDGTPRGIDIRA
ncbi:hypothetical protein HBF26_09805 [Luteibacter jiangsuensis]|uniref:Uncharacterized protein n=1 Tax=Luteibacter jiangsuensis TaxID=637577 RepID=A0ABX0Q5V2_9GAMM|nr:hypothetical protein [Luteibacter jiangsuensis]NID05181.1 hypothetical protein [Luteibacter jiangsuensis]